jgi:hypothetical protein
MAKKTTRRGDQIVIDTSLAYDAALARGAGAEAALDAAAAVYQQAYPRVGRSVSRHLAAVIAGHKLAKRTRLPDA